MLKKEITSACGGLLKFGFTGAPKVEPAPSVEFSQCPHCNGLFNSLYIFQHVGNCLDKSCSSASTVYPEESSASQTNTNAFDIMRKSAALKPPSTTSITSMHFALLMKDDKLLPVFSSSGDYIDQLYTQCNNHPNSHTIQWTCEANVKKFRWHFDTSEPSHRTILLHLSTNILEDMNVSFADTAPISTGWLKSMLQKSVRRKLNTKAVKLANMMCKTTTTTTYIDTGSISASSKVSTIFSSGKPPRSEASSFASATSSNTSLLSELLRRLPIICVEDAALHPAYPIIVWLMVAVSKGYAPNRFLINTILLITNDIASCTYKDCTPPAEYNLSVSATNKTNSDVSGLNITKSASSPGPVDTDTNTACLHTCSSIENDSVRTLIACICIRASFGGMLGDIEMLDQYAQLWYKRLVCGGDSGSSSQHSNINDTDQVTGVDASANKCTPLGMVCYLDPTYTAGFFNDTSSCKHWAKQMYDNFPAYPLQLVTAESDATSAIASRVEQCLLYILQGPAATSFTGPPANSITTNKASSKYSPVPRISTLLKVTAQDLVPEGLDHHCDWGLVPSILSTCTERVKQLTAQLGEISATAATTASPETLSARDKILSVLGLLNDPQLERNIKNAIWLFRSANNSRKLYPLIGQNIHIEVNQAVSRYYRELIDSDLAQKRSLAKLWSIVCPMIVSYCERKIVALSNRL